MAIVSNKNTTQKSMQSQGRTGLQTIKFIPAPRVYIAPASGTGSIAIPASISNGETPSGFVDLGTVVGGVKVNYQRKVKEVTTGIDNYFRGAYSGGTANTIEFSLGQLDDIVFEGITGLASTIVSSSMANYQTGSLDIRQLSLLLVVQNKFDGKEFQFFNPNAYVNFAFEDSGDALALKCTGYLPYFLATNQSAESIMSVTVFDAHSASIIPAPGSGYGADAWGTAPYDLIAGSGYSSSLWSSSPYGQ